MRVFEKFRVELLERGELLKINVEAENREAAAVAAVGERDVKNLELLAVRPLRVGFC